MNYSMFLFKYNKNLLKIKKYCSLAESSKSPASIANIPCLSHFQKYKNDIQVD